MKEALEEANKAFLKGEVPIGCVIVFNNEIIAKSHNMRESMNDATAHAELSAIKSACDKLKSWRLDNCDLYVTLEPCMMCSGAIMNARIRNLYYGASQQKVSSNILESEFTNYRPNIFSGLLESECALILSQFFCEKRKVKKEK